jgi:peptidoglycan/LPS O-acetylase OafA/YrhL
VKRVHLPALDGLRALSIALVIAHNCTLSEARSSILDKLWTFVTDAGWIGVQLFFVLSGFLITGILLDSRNEPHPYKTFYARRALRIFPLYYTFLIGRFLIVPLFIPDLGVPIGHQLCFWLYVSNWGDLILGGLAGLSHFWSLAVEEQYYLVWPALAGRIRDSRFAWTCGALAVVALVARILMKSLGAQHDWEYASTITRVDGLALGSLVALAIRSERGRAMLARARRPVIAVTLVLLAAVMAHAHGLSRFEWIVQTFGYSLLAILFAFLVAEVATPTPHGWRGWLAHPALTTVGRYSYAIYVFHLPIRFLLVRYWGPDILDFIGRHPLPGDLAFCGGVAVLSFLMAVVSYVVLERPFLRLKDRWAPT